MLNVKEYVCVFLSAYDFKSHLNKIVSKIFCIKSMKNVGIVNASTVKTMVSQFAVLAIIFFFLI